MIMMLPTSAMPAAVPITAAMPASASAMPDRTSVVRPDATVPVRRTAVPATRVHSTSTRMPAAAMSAAMMVSK
jgi:hypothetical protein